MNLLHLDSSILGPSSASRQLSAAAVSTLIEDDPTAIVVYRDLAADPIPHLSGAYLLAGHGLGQDVSGTDSELEHDLATGELVLEEFLTADIIVIGVAFYNFTIPSQLKAWIDRIAVAGKTFRYTEQGAEGLAGDKCVVLTIARGGLYGPDSPAASFEHAESYLRGVFGFLGVTDLKVIVAEGLRRGPEEHASAIAAAMKRIVELNTRRA